MSSVTPRGRTKKRPCWRPCPGPLGALRCALCKRLVRAGWAVAYRRYSTDYVATEAAAKAAGAGIWQGKFTAPEACRRNHR